MERDSRLFQALVVQLAQAGWVSLGKIPNPVDGKIERNLEAARLTIDTLDVLEVRTRGNLTEEERRLLDRTLRELRINYVDEQKRVAAAAKEPQATGEEPGEKPAAEAGTSPAVTGTPESSETPAEPRS